MAALVSFIVGFFWYNPKTFGKAWMVEAGVDEEKAKKANMLKVAGFSLLFAFLLAFSMQSIVIHQFGALGMVGGDATAAKSSFDAFMSDYGTAYRTFKHGAFHGIFAALFIVLPVLGTNALFEGKSLKYIFINAGYWVVCMTLMGGIMCAWQ